MVKTTFVKAALLSGAAVSALCVSGLPVVASAQEGTGGQSPVIVAQVATGQAPQAGSGIIEGRIVDAQDSPIAGAIVTIRQTGQFVVSDAAGRYRLLRVPSGTYTLVTSVVGRAPLETTVTVTADRTVEADLSLGGPMEEMVVTGLRGSVFSSLNQKRSSDQIIDVLSSAQSDRFPDNNVAEALSRLPGVSFLRDNATGNGDFDVTQPQNGDSAEVYGVEFGIYHQFSWLPGWLDGFGFFGNVTLVESEAKIETVVSGADNAFVILG